MKLKPDQLSRHLDEPLKSVYLVSGDEPLLMQESCDLIRNKARENGFSERDLLYGEPGDCETLMAVSETMSLFAEQKIMEFRFQKVPLQQFQDAFQNWCENPPQDQLLLISCPKLDKKACNKAWYKKILSLGFHVEVWPVDAEHLPGWLANRARKSGLNLENNAIRVLADRIEGNLLAAQQEIERLSLLYGDADDITAEMMKQYVGDNSRFSTFELLEASFAGNASRLTRILSGLKLEGEAAAKVNGLLVYELRNLTKMAWEHDKGKSIAQVLKDFYVWGNKKTGYTKSLQRFPVSIWHKILSRCLEIDKMIKGQAKGDPWVALESLLLQISGHGLWKARQ